MKYIKMLGLAAIALIALMAFVGPSTASATQLTGAGGAVLGVGTEIKAENEGKIVLDPPFGAIECEKSNLSGKVTNAGSATTTPTWLVTIFSIGPCPGTVHILKFGVLEIHTQTGSNNNNGRITWTGLEMTVQYLGTHCIFSTNNTEIGTVTGSTTTGSNATLDISATIPRTGGSSGAFCGSTAAWTGAYKFTSPNPLNIH